MGIRFIDSILALLAACTVVFSVYFVGHALASEHGEWAWITAGVLLVVGVALGFLTTRRIHDYAHTHDAHHHHGAGGHSH